VREREHHFALVVEYRCISGQQSRRHTEPRKVLSDIVRHATETLMLAHGIGCVHLQLAERPDLAVDVGAAEAEDRTTVRKDIGTPEQSALADQRAICPATAERDKPNSAASSCGDMKEFARISWYSSSLWGASITVAGR
jgi:hypothetical protein